MHVFNIQNEQEWDPKKHVEKILAEIDVGGGQAGDYTVACWEPGQISPNHCHPWCRARSASIRPAKFMSTLMVRNAPCCFGFAMAPTCCHGTSDGRAIPTSSRARMTPNTTARIRRDDPNAARLAAVFP
jgi:hypothetical protein